MRVKSIVSASALGLSAVLLLSGCGDEVSFGSGQGGEVAAAEEAGATDPTETPENFVRRWRGELDRMKVSGLTDGFLRISPNCEPCAEVAAQAAAVRAADTEVEFEGMKISKAVLIKDEPVTVRLVGRVPVEQLRYELTGELQRLPGRREVAMVVLERIGGQWAVEDYVVR
jgi:hypothetical protein